MPVSPTADGTAISTLVPACAPPATQSESVLISSADSRGSSTQPNRGVQSGDSCALNGGIVLALTCPIICGATVAASSYEVSENGAMPPSWWHFMQCFATIGAASWYHVTVGAESVVGAYVVPHAAVMANATTAMRMRSVRATSVPPI